MLWKCFQCSINLNKTISRHFSKNKIVPVKLFKQISWHKIEKCVLGCSDSVIHVGSRELFILLLEGPKVRNNHPVFSCQSGGLWGFAPTGKQRGIIVWPFIVIMVSTADQPLPVVSGPSKRFSHVQNAVRSRLCKWSRKINKQITEYSH